MGWTGRQRTGFKKPLRNAGRRPKMDIDLPMHRVARTLPYIASGTKRGRSRTRSASSARMASGSRTLTRTRRGIGAGGYGMSRTYNYKRSRLSRQRLRPAVAIPYVVQRLQRVKQEAPDSDPAADTYFPGSVIIRQGNSVTDAVTEMPVHIYDLTRFANGGTAIPVSTYVAINDAGVPSFISMNTQNNLSAETASQWYDEDSRQYSSTSATQGNFTKIQHGWHDIRLKLYGARKQAVTYDVYLMQFKESSLVPNEANANDSKYADFIQFYQGLVRSLTVNSILPGDTGYRRYMRVLRHRRIKLAPDDSTDLDRNPPSADLKWFVKDMRLLSYVKPNATFASDQATVSTNWSVQTLGGAQVDPDTRQRTFLVVTATDMTRNAALDDMDNSPSYDICIRRKSYCYR